MSKNLDKKQKRADFWERNQKTNGYLLQKKLYDIGFRLVRAFLLFGLCFLILQPIINKLSVSFMAEEDLFDASVISIPRHFSTSAYRITNSLLDYWKCMRNSFLLSLLVAILQVASATLVGYGFARFNFPFKKFWFACVILVIIIPPQTIMSPLTLFFQNFDIFGIVSFFHGGEPLNLKGSVVPYILMCMTCMGLKCGLYIYMLRQYFRGVPKELEEAAYVDGCGNLATFFRIMLPDAKAMITSCFLFSFVWAWTDSFYSRLFTGNLDLLPKGLNSLAGRLDQYVITSGNGTVASTALLNQMLATGTLLTILPLLVLYLFAQKGFVESLSQTGIKM